MSLACSVSRDMVGIFFHTAQKLKMARNLPMGSPVVSHAVLEDQSCVGSCWVW